MGVDVRLALDAPLLRAAGRRFRWFWVAGGKGGKRQGGDGGGGGRGGSKRCTALSLKHTGLSMNWRSTRWVMSASASTCRSSAIVQAGVIRGNHAVTQLEVDTAEQYSSTVQL